MNTHTGNATKWVLFYYKYHRNKNEAFIKLSSDKVWTLTCELYS